MNTPEFKLENKVLVIAEAGNNHEGDFECAKDMVSAAAESGADAIKFQTIIPGKLVQASEKMRLETLNRFKFSIDQFTELAEEARKANILFLSTPFDLYSVDELLPMVPAFKIASGDNTFYPLLEKVAATGKPVLLSTGLLDLNGVEQSIKVLNHVWDKEGHHPLLVLLHCVVCYPTAPDQANVGAIRDIASLGYPVGYSDHTIGIKAALSAVSLGARVIEKHFTLYKQQSDFRDHALSADPKDMAELVQSIRETEILLGHGKKIPSACESPMTNAVRRFITAGRDLPADSVITLEDLEWLRGAAGLPARATSTITGRRLKIAVSRGTPITEDLLD